MSGAVVAVTGWNAEVFWFAAMGAHGPARDAANGPPGRFTTGSRDARNLRRDPPLIAAGYGRFGSPRRWEDQINWRGVAATICEDGPTRTPDTQVSQGSPIPSIGAGLWHDHELCRE